MWYIGVSLRQSHSLVGMCELVARLKKPIQSNPDTQCPRVSGTASGTGIELFRAGIRRATLAGRTLGRAHHDFLMVG